MLVELNGGTVRMELLCSLVGEAGAMAVLRCSCLDFYLSKAVVQLFPPILPLLAKSTCKVLG